MKWYTYVVGPLETLRGYTKLNAHLESLAENDSRSEELETLHKVVIPSLMEVLHKVSSEEIPDVYVSSVLFTMSDTAPEYVFLAHFKHDNMMMLAAQRKMSWLEFQISLDDIPKL